ncbi:UNVERIFIED_CONTAM: hypothetical protein K2H54_024136 [Gekko kuhli]
MVNNCLRSRKIDPMVQKEREICSVLLCQIWSHKEFLAMKLKLGDGGRDTQNQHITECKKGGRTASRLFWNSKSTAFSLLELKACTFFANGKRGTYITGPLTSRVSNPSSYPPACLPLS